MFSPLVPEKNGDSGENITIRICYFLKAQFIGRARVTTVYLSMYCGISLIVEYL